MYLIEKASRAIASKTADILNLDEDRQEILEYGALNFLQTLLSVALIILFGILANSLLQILVLSLTAALLRQYSGGVHATSPYRCAALSVMIFGGLSLFVKHVLAFSSWIPVLLFQILTLSCVLILLYKYAPVDSPNKRITNPDTRRRLKKASMTFVLVFELITAVLWGVHLKYGSSAAFKSIICIQTGMLWQALSITAVLRSVIGWMDSLLIKLKFWKGGVQA